MSLLEVVALVNQDSLKRAQQALLAIKEGFTKVANITDNNFYIHTSKQSK